MDTQRRLDPDEVNDMTKDELAYVLRSAAYQECDTIIAILKQQKLLTRKVLRTICKEKERLSQSLTNSLRR